MRHHLQVITEESGVQVEPERVTKILNKFKENVENLVMCGVPGAGGDDAVSQNTKYFIYRCIFFIYLQVKIQRKTERLFRLKLVRSMKN